MNRNLVSALLWSLAFAVTLAIAVFQRTTGPSYPVTGSLTLEDGSALRYSLPRSHGGEDDLEIRVPAPGGWAGTVAWRRFPTEHPWKRLTMAPTTGGLAAGIPHQPPAGKVEYLVTLVDPRGHEQRLGTEEAVVARFRASVPAGVLVPHIAAMFGCMLVSTRALLEVMRKAGDGRTMVLLSMLLLVVGGLILGPMVQKLAFGALWTGWPIGTDLTDNKTAIAFLVWLPAAVAAWRRRPLKALVVVGWIVMMAVFMIPHSLRGSELAWDDPASGGAAAAPGPEQETQEPPPSTGG